MTRVRLLAALVAAAVPVAAGGTVAVAAKSKKADLKVSKVATPPAAVAPGGKLSLSVTTVNAGKGAAKASTTRLLLSLDAKRSTEDLKLAQRKEKALKPGKKATSAIGAAVPAAVPAGSYSILACADDDKKVKEGNEKNNCKVAGAIGVLRGAPAAPKPPVVVPTAAPTAQPTAAPTATATPAGPDTTAPDTIIESGPSGIVSSAATTFGFSSTEPGSTFECRADDGAWAACTSPRELPGLLAGDHQFEVRAKDAAGNVDATPAKRAWTIQLPAPLVGPVVAAAADPAAKAAEPETGVTTSVADSTKFLYEGSGIQKDVEADTIEAARAGVLRGTVSNRMGTAIGGVKVTVLDHPELGFTSTRDTDGGFDIAVNGGGPLTLVFERQGYLPAQRTLEAPAGDFAIAEPVTMVPLDPAVTGVDTTSTEPFQVVKGTPVTDADGTRRSVLLFPKGVEGRMTLPSGRRAALGETMNVRATEFTQGESGQEAMPGQLPPSSAYTYASEFSVDEAVKSGADEVTFNKPVITFVDNYLQFPVGTPVPAGYYDRASGEWKASRNGVVIKLLAEADGLVTIDTDGDGVADPAAELAGFGITEAERRQLAELYDAPKTLWRVQVGHFTPWDYNYPYGPPDDAAPPAAPPPDPGSPPDDPCRASGSIIGCEDQTLGEVLPLTGSAFKLRYSSDRMPGYRPGYSIEIPLAGSSVPASIKRADLEITVAGRTIHKEFENVTPGQRHTFVWDGTDAYGRTLQGEQPIKTKLSYVYGAVYKTPSTFASSFATFGGAPLSGNRARSEISSSQEWEGTIGGYDQPPAALGGWAIDAHHTYDPRARALLFGSGGRSSADGAAYDVISTAYGPSAAGPKTVLDLDYPRSIAEAADGSVLVADTGHHVVRRIDRDGTATVVAGTGAAGFAGDGGAATAAQLDSPADVTEDADGNLLIADTGNDRVRRVTPDGKIATIAGSGVTGYSGDDGPATDAALDAPGDVAADKDGGVYIAERGNSTIRRVDPEGTITTLTGNGTPGFKGDGGPAGAARLHTPGDIAVLEEGTLLIADTGNHRIRRITPDGIVETIAGTGTAGYTGDGGAATAARLNTPSGVTPAGDGSVLIADTGNDVVRSISSDGSISTLVGDGVAGSRGDRGPAGDARLSAPAAVLALDAGELLVADTGNHRLRLVEPPMPAVAIGEFSIPSVDGAEVYVFNRAGRHLRTLDGMSGAKKLGFAYDASGRLTQITDGNNRVTVIERTAGGTPTGILAPDGARTTFETDAAGLITKVTNPASESVELTYTATGLLSTLTEPDGTSVHAYEYDELGRLHKDIAPDGGVQTLDRTTSGGADTVTLTTAMGRTTTYRTEQLADGSRKRTVTDPSGGKTISISRRDGTVESTLPDGTVTVSETGPDPRWGMRAPVTVRSTSTSPDGRKLVTEELRSATLADPDDPFSVTTLTTSVKAGGATTEVAYKRDGATATITTVSAAGRRSVSTVDALGRPLSVRPADGIEPTVTTWDAQGRVLKRRTGALGFDYTYDGRGRIASVTSTGGETSTYDYDGADRTTAVTSPGARTYAFGYDANGRRTSITTPRGKVHTFGYNALGLTTSYDRPGAGDYGWSYDKDGLVTTSTLPGDDTATFTEKYDDGARGLGTTWSDASTSVTYAGATDRVASETRTPATGDGQTIATAYDGGLITSLEFGGASSGTYTYGYDARYAANSVKLVSGADTVEHAIERDADGRITKYGPFTIERTLAGGAPARYSDGSGALENTVDALGRLTSKKLVVAGQTLMSIGLAYDDDNRLQSRPTTVAGTTTAITYGYDAAGRLAGVTRDGTQTEAYGYDGSGNRTSERHEGDLVAETAVFDDDDKLISRKGVNYSWSADGYLAQRGSEIFDYSPHGELLSATTSGGDLITYAYDSRGRRVLRNRSGAVERYLYGNPSAPERVTAIRHASGQLDTLFYDEAGMLYAFQRGSTRYYVGTDQAGTPLVVADASGTVVKRLRYDAYGRRIEDTAPGFRLPIGFAGGIDDPDTGLVRFNVRDYDPQAGRFTAPDPMLWEGRAPNLYAYASDDPVNQHDPTGLASIGFSAYPGPGAPGGGVKLGIGSDAWSICLEGGAGWGGGFEVDPFAPVDETNLSTFAEAQAQALGTGGTLGWKKGVCDLNPTPTAKGCIGLICMDAVSGQGGMPLSKGALNNVFGNGKFEAGAKVGIELCLKMIGGGKLPPSWRNSAQTGARPSGASGRMEF